MTIEQAYQIWARIYDSNKNLTRDLDQKVLPELLTDLEKKDVVEAGCGTGKNTMWFADKARRVIAFDLSEHMLQYARYKIKKHNVILFKHNILEQWPIENRSVDVVSINLVLEHLPRIDFPISEANRILKKNGILCICELHPRKHMSGSQAKYVDPETNNVIKVESYLHSEHEYRQIGEKYGFEKICFQDWYDEVDKKTPRLLSIMMTQ